MKYNQQIEGDYIIEMWPENSANIEVERVYLKTMYDVLNIAPKSDQMKIMAEVRNQSKIQPKKRSKTHNS
jgi:hypothetical protein